MSQWAKDYCLLLGKAFYNEGAFCEAPKVRECLLRRCHPYDNESMGRVFLNRSFRSPDHSSLSAKQATGEDSQA
jgi:hypothetical protein